MRVLIVDDSPDYLALLRRYLARELVGVDVDGYLPAEHAGVVPDAASLAADVVLLDYQLGDARAARRSSS